MVHRRGFAGLTLVALASLSLSACQTASRSGSARDEGYARLSEGDYVTAQSKFETAAATSRTDEERARAYVGLGNLALTQGRPKNALRYFTEARKLHHSGAMATAIDHGTGVAHYSLGDYLLAGRYLRKAIPGLNGAERNAALARVVVCYRAYHDADAAAEYRSKIARPYPPEVARILATQPTNPASSIARPTAGHAPSDVCTDSSCPQCPVPDPTRPLPPPSAKQGTNLVVYTRTDWGARPTKRNVIAMGRVSRITIHHTGGPEFWGESREAAANQISAIQRFHQTERGWADIGYHFVVDRAGNVWQGRPLKYQGAHARGSLNDGNIGIALLGNFCSQRPTRAQYESLSILVATFCAHLRLSPDRVYTHGELADGKTSCPGPALTRCVYAIRRSLGERILAYQLSSTRPR